MKKLNYKDYLSTSEVQSLRQANDAKALWMFGFNWLVVVLCFFVLASSASIAVKVLAMFVLAGRQLGLGILMHECGHQAFFSTVPRNRFFGHWLAGMPLLIPLEFYRTYHLQHHAKTGSEEDPDVGNIAQYPVSKASMVRKVLRDFSGLSGLKMLYGVLFFVLPNRAGNAVSLGINKEKVSSGSGVAFQNISHATLLHTLFIALFYAVGEPWLYLMWWVSYIFFYPFIIRVRQIAEHGAMPALASADVRDTTRTTIASWFARAFFAPNYVNYHCEHHFLPTVPSYNLAAMHVLLRERGFYAEHPEALVNNGGYVQVLRVASSL